jgi:hypothetical protein
MKAKRQWIFALLCLAVPLAAAAAKRQGLPVTVSRDVNSQMLRWNDSGGVLTGEVPWVLRSDLRGPETYLVVETKAGDPSTCAEELRFRVLAAQRIEYRVAVRSDLGGTVSWAVEYGEGKSIRLFACVPRPSEDRRACLKGGVPRPLLALLLGALEARLRGSEAFVPVEVVRFATAPTECAPAG